jgi:hypothetical protein
MSVISTVVEGAWGADRLAVCAARVVLFLTVNLAVQHFIIKKRGKCVNIIAIPQALAILVIPETVGRRTLLMEQFELLRRDSKTTRTSHDKDKDKEN